jgi:DNA-directed RNA polymerase specialized sigma subunit
LTLILENNFKFEYIEKAMKKLDEISSDIIYLKFIEEKNNDEIADVL